jgi:ATP-dependent Clp protease, protease subunit
MTKLSKAAKPWVMNAKAGELEILLYEMIGQDYWTGEGTTAKQFAEDLEAAGKISKIHLRVNSPGGSVFDGLAIYNTLLSHGAKVTAQVDGLAASIASVIIMAASEISMGDNAMLMIHNPWTSVQGDSNDMRKMAETMDKVKVSMVTAYRRHTKKTVDEVGAIMDEETWMTADEAVSEGFAESVTKPEDADLAANFDLSRFHNVPPQIAAQFGRPKAAAAGYCACACAACLKGDCEDCTMDGCSDAACKVDDCPMQQKDAKAKARAKAKRAKKAAAGAAGVCSCPCLPCNQADCEDCSNDACADPACKAEGCPMQEAAASGAGPCSCPCLPCNQGKCGECTNDLCGDPHCKAKGCPNQKASDAKMVIDLRARLVAQTDRATLAETILREARLALETERKERAAGTAGEGKWMARVHSGLDRAAEKIFELGSSLTSRQQAIAGRAASKAVQAGLAEIGVTLALEKGARAGERAALGRIGSDADKAAGRFAVVRTGLAEHQAATDRPEKDRLKILDETLMPVVEAINDEQKTRALDTAAVQRVAADVEKASETFAAVQAELLRRQHPAMADLALDRLKGLEEKLAAASACLAQEKTARATDGGWIATLSEEVAAIIASLTQEIAQEKTARAAAEDERLAHTSGIVNHAVEAFSAVQAAVAEFSTINAGIAASTSRTKRVDGENLTAECFLWVGDPEKTETWALPWRFSSEEKTESHLRDALARFDQEEKIPASEKPAVHARLVKLCKEHGITVNEKDAKAMAAALLDAAGTDPFKGLEEKIGELQGFVAWEEQWQRQESAWVQGVEAQIAKIGPLEEFVALEKSAQTSESEWLQGVVDLVAKLAIAPVTELAAALTVVQAEVLGRQRTVAGSLEARMKPVTELAAALAAVQTEVMARKTTVAGGLEARMKPLEEKLAQVADVVAVGKVTLTQNGERLEMKLAQAGAAATREKTLLAANAEELGKALGVIDKAAIALLAVQAETARPLLPPSEMIDKAGAALAAVQAKLTARVGAPVSDRPEIIRVKALEDAIAGFSAAVAEEKNARTVELAWPKRMGADVELSAAAFKSAYAELWRRQFLGEAAAERLQKLGKAMSAMAALVTEEKTARAGETAWTKTVSEEVEQLAGVFKDVRADLAHREYPAEAAMARLEELQGKLAAIVEAFTRETAERAADVEALAAMAASVKEAGTALESANEELGRRARLAAL